jgi:glycosyltransferase involved in cell wall biosynthesis
MPSLSIVIPIRDEPSWIGVAVADLVRAVEQSGLDAVELIVVDDGSQTPTQDALRALRVPFPFEILRLEPSGRFAARRAGTLRARHSWVMLLDSRVSVAPDALQYVLSELPATGAEPVWNAHVDVEVDGNPYARFWNVLTELAFRTYFSAPRRTTYGLDDFDRFPKGTTCFIAPRAALLSAMDGVDSLYADLSHANDDTLMIRELARQYPINIGPRFSCVYRSRTTLRGFLRHAHHRGGVFIDGYGRPGTRFFPFIAAFFPVSMFGACAAIRRPRTAGALGALGLAASFVATTAVRRDARDGAVIASLGPAWTVVFAAGMWRGGLRALITRWTK